MGSLVMPFVVCYRGPTAGAFATYENNSTGVLYGQCYFVDRVVQDLVAISRYLAGPGQSTDFMSVYHQIRSTQLGRSLAA